MSTFLQHESVQKILFLDESGDHDLQNIDPQYPVFVLGGVIVDKVYAERQLETELNNFKQEFFNRTDLILRTSDISRNRNGFEQLQNSTFRKEFYKRINSLMRSLSYTVVACAIKKGRHLERCGLAAIDPYMLSLNILVERFCFDVGAVPSGGFIVAEKRGHMLDRELDLAWLELKIKGTQYLSSSTIEERIIGLVTIAKKENVAGLQLADLVISPLARWILGKRTYEDFDIVEQKLRRRSGNTDGPYLGSGLIILPKD